MLHLHEVLCQIKPVPGALAPNLTWAYAKDVKFSADVQALILQGIDLLAGTIPSYGAKGKNSD